MFLLLHWLAQLFKIHYFKTA